MKLEIEMLLDIRERVKKSGEGGEVEFNKKWRFHLQKMHTSSWQVSGAKSMNVYKGSRLFSHFYWQKQADRKWNVKRRKNIFHSILCRSLYFLPSTCTRNFYVWLTACLPSSRQYNVVSSNSHKTWHSDVLTEREKREWMKRKWECYKK